MNAYRLIAALIVWAGLLLQYYLMVHGQSGEVFATRTVPATLAFPWAAARSPGLKTAMATAIAIASLRIEVLLSILDLPIPCTRPV
mgnify:CR=1 FL=1